MSAAAVGRSLLSGVVTALLVLSATARAAPLFSASTTNGMSQSNSTGASSTGLLAGPLPGGPTGEPPGSSFTQQESAAANAGGLHASAQSTLNVAAPANLQLHTVTGSASATMTFSDLFITGPLGFSVPASLNLHLDGTFGTNITFFGTFIGQLTSSADVSISGAAFNSILSGSFTQQHFVSTYCDGSTPVCFDTTSANGTGLLSGTGPLPANLTTAALDLPLNQPLPASLGSAIVAIEWIRRRRVRRSRLPRRGQRTAAPAGIWPPARSGPGRSSGSSGS